MEKIDKSKLAEHLKLIGGEQTLGAPERDVLAFFMANLMGIKGFDERFLLENMKFFRVENDPNMTENAKYDPAQNKIFIRDAAAKRLDPRLLREGLYMASANREHIVRGEYTVGFETVTRADKIPLSHGKGFNEGVTENLLYECLGYFQGVNPFPRRFVGLFKNLFPEFGLEDLYFSGSAQCELLKKSKKVFCKDTALTDFINLLDNVVGHTDCPAELTAKAKHVLNLQNLTLDMFEKSKSASMLHLDIMEKTFFTTASLSDMLHTTMTLPNPYDAASRKFECECARYADNAELEKFSMRLCKSVQSAQLKSPEKEI
jgi:hypothetical protein